MHIQKTDYVLQGEISTRLWHVYIEIAPGIPPSTSDVTVDLTLRQLDLFFQNMISFDDIAHFTCDDLQMVKYMKFEDCDGLVHQHHGINSLFIEYTPMHF